MAEQKPSSKYRSRCECGRAYPRRLIARAFWTGIADAELIQLRNEGMTYHAIGKELNVRHGTRLTTDQVYYRHITLCNAAIAEKPIRAVVREPKPPKQKPPKPVIVEPVPVKKHSNQCTEVECNRMRANGYLKCLAHLPPLVFEMDAP